MQRCFHGFVEWKAIWWRVSMSTLLVLAIAVLSGCAAPVLMKNPTSGEIAQCYASGDLFRRYYDRDKCAEEYQKQGWVVAEKP